MFRSHIIIVCFIFLFVACEKNSRNSANTEETGFITTAKDLFRVMTDIVIDRILYFNFFPGVDVAKALVSSFKIETIKTDLTETKDVLRGIEFDRFDEHHDHRVVKGITVDEFESVVRTIAASNDLPETFINEILVGRYVDTNRKQKKEFRFSEGKDSSAWFCVVETAKVGSNKMDLAMAYFNLKFKMADREFHHTKDWTFLGASLWTDEWTTSEPRKLSMKDQNLFVNYLRAEAITGFIGDHGHVTEDNSDNQDD